MAKCIILLDSDKFAHIHTVCLMVWRYDNNYDYICIPLTFRI